MIDMARAIAVGAFNEKAEDDGVDVCRVFRAGPSVFEYIDGAIARSSGSLDGWARMES